ncbi:MAG: DinB family protein, partial [Brevibacillus sp.]|nr:DinB family protein [Brevibacillus sp.]
MLERPSRDEFTQYYRTYIDLVPEGDLINTLHTQFEETRQLLTTISEEQALYRYEAGKWTLKEVVGHIADTERIMNYRLLRIARGDKLPLASYDDIE